MVRRLLDRLNPTRGLPKPMRRYLGLPNRLLLGWLVLTLLIPVATARLQRWGIVDLAPAPQEGGGETETTPAGDDSTPMATEPADAMAVAESGGVPAEAVAAPVPPPLADGAEIAVGGSTPFVIANRGGQVAVTVPGQGALVLTGDDDDWRLRNAAGQVVYRLKLKSEEKGKLYDGAGAFRFRLKCESDEGQDGCKLYDPAGNRISRVKIKDDSFNVYGPGEQRLYKGKLKDGAYDVRDESKRSVATIRGTASLRQAALLALPVEIPVRVLLWRHAGR
ncbi:MAG: hypothetical protein FIA97_13965 [Methylococcaceae bacterium]|nr:hypothetical protein [Methylococcaceae bacterium]